MFFKIKTKD